MKYTPEEYCDALIQAAKELTTGEPYRQAEINNLVQAVDAIRYCFREKIAEVTELIEDLNDIRERIKGLSENPRYAGNHEQFKQN
jgi:hypothetical protein